MKLVVATVMVLVAERAKADDFVVRYDVEDKPLKEAASGTMLTFSLYEDAACTTFVATQDIAIDDVKVSRLKRFAPSGGAKPPKTDTIEAKITSSGLAAAAYLKVTGLGVTPVGGDCQPQATNNSGKVVGMVSMAGIDGSVPIGGPDFAFVGTYGTISVSEGETLVASAHAALRGFPGAKSISLGVCYQNSFLGGPIVNFAGTFGPHTVADSALESHTYSAAGSVVPGAGLWDVGLCAQSSTDGFVGYSYGSGFAMVVR
jgi:hypothetical protein